MGNVVYRVEQYKCVKISPSKCTFEVNFSLIIDGEVFDKLQHTLLTPFSAHSLY